MKFVTVSEAKLQLSALILLAKRGEMVVITRHGKPVVRLVVVHENEFRHEGESNVARAARKLSK